MKAILALILVLWASHANAACRCGCVDGRSRAICQFSYDVAPMCAGGACYGGDSSSGPDVGDILSRPNPFAITPEASLRMDQMRSNLRQQRQQQEMNRLEIERRRLELDRAYPNR
jgi:hypothetical protein